ncbi:uncharacterized protein F5147DRAFT_522560, partial [Suillus discolor]
MAQIAHDYHESLQEDSLSDQEKDIRATEIRNTLREIPQAQKLQNENSPLHNPLKENSILKALYASKAGSAAGIDGIPYEVWKSLHEKHLDDRKKDIPSFDIMKTLTIVINNIQKHGVDDQTDFS